MTGIAFLCAAFATAGPAAEHRVTFTPEGDTLRIRVNERPLATYVYRDPEDPSSLFQGRLYAGGRPSDPASPPQKGH